MGTALVTGGAGFIGSHLVEALLERGDNVLVLDNFSTGSAENLTHLLTPEAIRERGRRGAGQLRYVQGDVSDEDLLGDLLDVADDVYHLASAVGVFLVSQSALSTIDEIVLPTRKLLDMVVAWQNVTGQKKNVLLASTSEVYGRSAHIPFSEEQDLTVSGAGSSRWSYASSKILTEFLGLGFYREKGVPVVIVRPFNVTGPRQRGQYGMVMPRLVRQALEGKMLTVTGDGSQTRCFTHVEDAVQGMMLLMDNIERTAGQIFNLGNPQTEISIAGLARMILRELNLDAENDWAEWVKFIQHDTEDVHRRVPDISKIQKAVGYQPTRGLRQIVQDVIEYQSEQIVKELEEKQEQEQNRKPTILIGLSESHLKELKEKPELEKSVQELATQLLKKAKEADPKLVQAEPFVVPQGVTIEDLARSLMPGTKVDAYGSAVIGKADDLKVTVAEGLANSMGMSAKEAADAIGRLIKVMPQSYLQSVKGIEMGLKLQEMADEQLVEMAKELQRKWNGELFRMEQNGQIQNLPWPEGQGQGNDVIYMEQYTPPPLTSASIEASFSFGNEEVRHRIAGSENSSSASTRTKSTRAEKRKTRAKRRDRK